MPDFSALSDLFGALKKAFGAVSGLAGSLGDPLAGIDNNTALLGSLGIEAPAEPAA